MDRQNEILAAIAADELNGLAESHLTLGDMIIVVVGDRATIQDELEGLGYEIVPLGADGTRRKPGPESAIASRSNSMSSSLAVALATCTRRPRRSSPRARGSITPSRS